MSNNAIRVSTAELAAGLQEAVKIKTAEAVAQIQTELTSLQRKVEEIEEENKRLKQHIIHNYQDLHPNGDGIPHTEFFPGGRYAVEDDGTRTPYSALCGQIGEGIDELKEKNKGLEEELLYYQMCVYSMDPRNRYCSPAKEDVDGFTECPQQRKILYERIGYESESDDEE
jgi:FtsZ-binding cell division protein ZapB